MRLHDPLGVHPILKEVCRVLSEIFRGPLRDPLRGRVPSQRLSVLLPPFICPLNFLQLHTWGVWEEKSSDCKLGLPCTVMCASPLCLLLLEAKNVYTKGVFSTENASASTGRKEVWCIPKSLFSLVFKGKRRKIHIHQRAFKVFVGNPFAQCWCIDFGLLSWVLFCPTILSVKDSRVFVLCDLVAADWNWLNLTKAD